MYSKALLLLLVLSCTCIIQSYAELNKNVLNDLFVTAAKVVKKRYAAKQAPGEQNFHPFNSDYYQTYSVPMYSVHDFSGTSVTANQYADIGIEVNRQVSQMDSGYNFYTSERKYHAPERFCPFKIILNCDPNAPYRSFDGSCNNLKNAWWGQSDTPYKRYIPPDYADGMNEPRRSIDGFELPNPRDISCTLHTDLPYETEPVVSHMLMQWGQFMNHDFTLVATSKTYQGRNVDCGACRVDEVCRPIFMNNASFCSNCASRMQNPCITFIRSSATFPDMYCSIGQREQHNLQTGFLDGSHIYGANVPQAEKLRDRSSGKGLLRVTSRPNRKDLLPTESDDLTGCEAYAGTHGCFMSGDTRTNQVPSLSTMHTVWVREHNRIANILSNLNPQWEEETIFQETRRIIIAFLQHITYWEWLPKILGARTMKQYNLYPIYGKYFTGYDEWRDPRTVNEWATAAQRFGHSLIRSQYVRADSNYKQCGAMSLKTTFFSPNAIYNDHEGGLESIVRGLLKDTSMKSDEWFSEDITKHLFEVYDDNGRPSYFDLVAINIARGRDHGLPSYVKFRNWCRLPPVYTWEDLKYYMLPETVDILSTLYRYVEDIDLFVGGVSEWKDSDALVGPTFACLIGQQFQDWKYGDRFWYEIDREPGRFTPKQLDELRKITFSRVLCNNLENTPYIQPEAFLTPKAPNNQLVDCSSIPDVDFSAWKV